MGSGCWNQFVSYIIFLTFDSISWDYSSLAFSDFLLERTNVHMCQNGEWLCIKRWNQFVSYINRGGRVCNSIGCEMCISMVTCKLPPCIFSRHFCNSCSSYHKISYSLLNVMNIVNLGNNGHLNKYSKTRLKLRSSFSLWFMQDISPRFLRNPFFCW